MSLSKAKLAATYQQMIFGTYGRFSTPSGYVNFLSTKARLGKADTSLEHRLTGFLSPVREVLPHKDMNFNQLLQRDLDDHRVAVELVPYLFGKESDSPAFFPPIVAALLPFDGKDPVESFPDFATDVVKDEIASWSSESYQDSFRFDKLQGADDEDHLIKAGRLLWNPEKAKLVVIDGQHRAMALLAVDRTINSKWSGTAEKYKSFYEPVVNDLLQSHKMAGNGFDEVEFPVTLIWFPAVSGSHQKAARKIFVDLNKNARKPSDSRILLLSDDDLISVFTRSTLNQFREDNCGFPIYAVEYDNPESDQTSATKWSVVTNVSLISDCVKRILSGPSKHFDDLSSKFGGKESSTVMGFVFRDSLNLPAVLEEVITEDKLYKRDLMTAKDFPPSKIPLFEEQYRSGWGSAIQEIYSALLPFKAHADALADLKNGWVAADSAATLAKDSIFEGVGVYWTLRDSDAHWREINLERRDSGDAALPKTDVIDAWTITQKKKDEFFQLRAKHYLGSSKKVGESEAAFQIFSTAACQLGLVLALRAVAAKTNLVFEQIPKYSESFVSTVNDALKTRMLFLAKEVPANKRRFNLITKLDTPYAAHFRYFWIELVSSDDNGGLADYIDSVSLAKMAADGRTHYRSYLIEELFKDMRRANIDPQISDTKLRLDAEIAADKQLFDGLRSWFGFTKEDYDTWRTGLKAPAPLSGELLLAEDGASVVEEVANSDDVDEFIHKMLKE